MSGANETPPGPIEAGPRDALVIVDVQNDFVSGGSLAVPRGEEVVAVLNRYIDAFVSAGRPVFATRDWHPALHCSFKAQGGIWPNHCVVGTAGAEFVPSLALPEAALVISKGTDLERDAYSGFGGTELDAALRRLGAQRLFVGGLATDYCVLNTVRDALAHGFDVVLLTDAIRAVDLRPGDGDKAIAEMRTRGARTVTLDQLAE